MWDLIVSVQFLIIVYLFTLPFKDFDDNGYFSADLVMVI